MNQETIEIHIKGLSKQDFDSVLSLVLNKIFRLSAIDVDGKGDGGSDFRCFSDRVENLTVAIQKTIQDAQWQAKAIEDATKARDKLKAKRFYFLTSRARESTSLLELEDDILTQVGLPAKCLGATEIAGLIFENKLLGDFAHAINLPMDVSLEHQPDQKEIMLHTYFCLSDDRRLLQNEMYEKTVIIQLYKADSPLDREKLIDASMDFIGAQEVRRRQINGRVDSLLTHGQIIKVAEGLQLSDEVKRNIQIANGVYKKDVEQLTAAQADLLREYGGEWDYKKSSEASILLARCFVERQLKTAKHASLSFTMTGFGDLRENSKSELKKLILDSGTPSTKLNELMSKMVELASNTAIINKLMNSIVYVALENSNAVSSAYILGTSNWREVRVILDASVAMPYLCTSLFGTSEGRFSKGSNETIRLLLEKGAKIRIPWYYLNECASHLVAAQDYFYIDDFDKDLAFSQNSYVSHYYQLKRAGVRVPNSLVDFIKILSEKACSQSVDRRQTIRMVMQDLQPLFKEYEVGYEDIKALKDIHTKDIQIDYAYKMNELSRKKPANLIEHDVNVLGHIWRCVSERYDKILCLTWDAVMIGVGASQKYGGWIVSPVEAADLIQAKMPINSVKMMSLAHVVASSVEKTEALGARILDRAIQLSAAKMKDWEFKQKIASFKKEAIARIDINQDDFNLEAFDKETDKFLREQGFEMADIPLEIEEDIG